MTLAASYVNFPATRIDPASLKPKLRGWLHAAYTPLVLAATIVLLVLAPASGSRMVPSGQPNAADGLNAAVGLSAATGLPIARLAIVIFGLTALSLFGTSAVYHIGNGKMRAAATAVLKKIDHANIFLIIAGTYTPLAVLLLPTNSARTILTIVWSGALAGTLAHLLWKSAPRWVYAPVYVALGWVAVAFMRQFAEVGGLAIVALIVSGGIAYTAGAVIYAIKRPNPSLKWFGFHEVFHAFTVLGFACHTVAVFVALLAS